MCIYSFIFIYSYVKRLRYHSRLTTPVMLSSGLYYQRRELQPPSLRKRAFIFFDSRTRTPKLCKGSTLHKGYCGCLHWAVTAARAAAGRRRCFAFIFSQSQHPRPFRQLSVKLWNVQTSSSTAWFKNAVSL